MEFDSQNANIEEPTQKRTVIFHVKGCWSVVILYPGTIVQKSVQNSNQKKVSLTLFRGLTCSRLSEQKTPTTGQKIQVTTYRMLPTSLPTLLA
jgi:hypothetical protein